METETPLQLSKIIAMADAWEHAGHYPTIRSDYKSSIRDFFDLLSKRKIPFTIIGDIALLQHIPARTTEDIDIILSASSLGQQVSEIVVEEHNDMFVKATFGPLRIDILLTEFPLFERVLNEFSSPMSYDVGRFPTASIDGLLLLKLFALPSLYQQHDLDRVAIYEADITQLLSRSTKSDSFFLKILESHLSEPEVIQLSDILTEIRAKLAKLGK